MQVHDVVRDHETHSPNLLIPLLSYPAQNAQPFRGIIRPEDGLGLVQFRPRMSAIRTRIVDIRQFPRDSAPVRLALDLLRIRQGDTLPPSGPDLAGAQHYSSLATPFSPLRINPMSTSQVDILNLVIGIDSAL